MYHNVGLPVCYPDAKAKPKAKAKRGPWQSSDSVPSHLKGALRPGPEFLLTCSLLTYSMTLDASLSY